MKMKHRAKSVLSTLFVQFVVLGNVFGQITGLVLSSDKKPLESAPVSLLLATDSSVLKVTLSDANGKFRFVGLKSAKYRIGIVMMGYKPYQSDVLEVSDFQKEITFEPIVLQPADLKLKELTVTGQKNFVEFKIDRTVVNVDALISNAGTSILEVLEKSPGVIVDQNGAVSLNGQSGVLVMIDNRPTYLSATALIAYLKSLPSSTVDQIELITNPPARYDAAGSAGIINIKTKKSKIRGLNGSFSISAGRSSLNKHNEGVNLNYRNNQFNLFTNASFNSNDSWRKLEIGRRYYSENNDLVSAFDQTTFFFPKSRMANLKAGLDFYANSKTTIGMVFTGAYSRTGENRPVISKISNAYGALDSLILADNHQKNRFNQNGANFNFSHKYDSTGHSITFDLDCVNYRIRADQTFENSFFDPDNKMIGQENIVTNLPSSIRIYTARTDYERPLKSKGKLSLGSKSGYVSTDNAANYFFEDNGEKSVDYEKTNRFRYKENINAGSVNFNKEFSKISFQLGLRAENTNVNGYQMGNAVKNDSSFTNHYSSLFPTAYLSYKLDSNNTRLNLSYGRRIGRPYYQDLNPFVFLLDKFSYFAGNPFLKPEFGNKFMVSVSYKGRFNLSLLYNYTNNLHGEVIEQKDNIFISRTGNISRVMWGGVTFSANLKAGNWYTCNLYLEIIRNNYKGMPGNENGTTGSTYGYISANNQFLLKNGWSAEMSGFYLTKSQSAQFAKAGIGVINVALQKKVLAGKGAVKVTLRDILSSMNPHGTIGNIPNATATYYNDADTRIVNATFTYSFSKGVAAKVKRNIGGSGSEEGRVKN